MTTTATPAVAWKGWWRANKKCPWTFLCRSTSYDACWQLLLDAIADVRGGDSLVTTADVDPNGRTRRQEGQRR